VEIPVGRGFHSRASIAALCRVGALLFAAVPALCQPSSQPGPHTAPPALAANPPDTASDIAAPDAQPANPGWRRDALLGMALWDHTLLGAFALGQHFTQLTASAAMSARAAAAPAASTAVLRYSAPRSRVSIESIVNTLNINQIQRQGMNLRMSSPFGNFRLQYRELFNVRPNSLGGGLGQASAAATYTTPRFGAGGLWDLSAAALMGTGSINQLLGNGFGSSLIGGNGPGRKSDTAPTVAIKLTF
jgi:hypothetical protein